MHDNDDNQMQEKLHWTFEVVSYCSWFHFIRLMYEE